MPAKKFTAFDPALLGRANQSIAHGALTNSKRPECLVRGVYPTHLVRGKGCFVWDTKDNRYIDFIGGLGSSILGYAHDEVNAAMRSQMERGATLSLSTELEITVAEKIKELFPWIEQVRFIKTGTDACNASVRIARTHTQKAFIYSEGYHGWGDEFVSLTPPALGVSGEFNIHSLNSAYSPIGNAAMIIEPIMTNISKERIDRVRSLREECTNTNTLLIFDEIITGFRFPKMSAANHFGIEPDLICLGKAIANGMPLSVVAGKKSIMECDEYFVSSTFAGETLSLAAALKTMTLLQTKYSLEYLWDKGAQFLFKFNDIWPEGLSIEGYPTRGVFKGETEIKALFWQECCKAGILFGPSWFFNFSHIDQMDLVLAICREILLRVKRGEVKLEGELPKTPFAQKVRQS